MNTIDNIAAAERRIRQHILTTPLVYSPVLNKLNRGTVFLKLENEQCTGSFKARGALNKVLVLSPAEKAAGLITASTGNHAQGFARALSISGDTGSIFLPENASSSKVEALKKYDVSLEFYGVDALETEVHAREMARDSGQQWISPYNDQHILAGQGTVAVEILAQLENVDAVFVCIGGGGLMSGIASWVKHHKPDTKIIGCLPTNSPEMYLSVKADRIIELDNPLDTLSDGSAGGIEPGAITFDICRALVDQYVLVDEDEIANAMRLVYHNHNQIIEGAAGVAVGAFIKSSKSFIGQNVAIVICGGNVSKTTLQKVLDEDN